MGAAGLKEIRPVWQIVMTTPTVSMGSRFHVTCNILGFGSRGIRIGFQSRADPRPQGHFGRGSRHWRPVSPRVITSGPTDGGHAPDIRVVLPSGRSGQALAVSRGLVLPDPDLLGATQCFLSFLPGRSLVLVLRGVALGAITRREGG